MFLEQAYLNISSTTWEAGKLNVDEQMRWEQGISFLLFSS